MPEKKASPLADLAGAFSPNRVVSATTVKILVVAEAALFLLVWLNSPFRVLPQPGEVFRALGRLWAEEGLGRELITSYTLNLQALFYATLISLGLSYATVMPAFRPLVTAVSKGRFLGLIGLTFIFTLLVGGGRPLKLSLLVFGMSVFFITSMAQVVAELPRDQFDYARTLRMNEWQVVWEVVVRGTLDKAFEVLRQNAAIGWTMLTLVEGIARSEGGMGTMLLNENKHFRLPEVFAIQLLILLVGLLQDYGIGILRRIACPYAELSLERR